METNSINIGKIRTFDNYVGEIVSQDGIYLFTKENTIPEENLKENDTVIFRGEKINNTNVAYFIKRLDPNLDFNEQIKTKTKKNIPQEYYE